MGTRSKKKKKNSDNAFLLRLTGRSTFFLALFTLALAALYVSGNFQRFLDGTQRFLLFLCCLTSITLALLAVSGAAQCLLIFVFTRRRRYLLFLGAFLAVLAVIPVLFAAFRLITFLSAGLRP